MVGRGGRRSPCSEWPVEELLGLFEAAKRCQQVLRGCIGHKHCGCDQPLSEGRRSDLDPQTPSPPRGDAGGLRSSLIQWLGQHHERNPASPEPGRIPRGRAEPARCSWGRGTRRRTTKESCLCPSVGSTPATRSFASRAAAWWCARFAVRGSTLPLVSMTLLKVAGWVYRGSGLGYSARAGSSQMRGTKGDASAHRGYTRRQRQPERAVSVLSAQPTRPGCPKGVPDAPPDHAVRGHPRPR